MISRIHIYGTDLVDTFKEWMRLYKDIAQKLAVENPDCKHFQIGVIHIPRIAMSSIIEDELYTIWYSLQSGCHVNDSEDNTVIYIDENNNRYFYLITKDLNGSTNSKEVTLEEFKTSWRNTHDGTF